MRETKKKRERETKRRERERQIEERERERNLNEEDKTSRISRKHFLLLPFFHVAFSFRAFSHSPTLTFYVPVFFLPFPYTLPRREKKNEVYAKDISSADRKGAVVVCNARSSCVLKFIARIREKVSYFRAEEKKALKMCAAVTRGRKQAMMVN